jgi:hypothetical protein
MPHSAPAPSSSCRATEEDNHAAQEEGGSDGTDGGRKEGLKQHQRHTELRCGMECSVLYIQQYLRAITTRFTSNKHYQPPYRLGSPLRLLCCIAAVLTACHGPWDGSRGHGAACWLLAAGCSVAPMRVTYLTVPPYGTTTTSEHRFSGARCPEQGSRFTATLPLPYRTSTTGKKQERKERRLL